MARRDHRRTRWIGNHDLTRALRMNLNSHRPRILFRYLVLVFTMTLLNPVFLAGQHNPRDGEHLLESGQAEKLLSPGAASEIKIVSYNIRWRSGADLQQIIDWLKTTKDSPAATIIGLQEVDRAKKRSGHGNHAKALAERLGMYYAWAAPHVAAGEKNKEEETGVELLSCYPLTEITRIVLPNPGPGGRARVALGATIKIGDTSMRAYSVHSETRLTMAKKIDQLQAVLDDLARFPKVNAAIVVGDFNSWELPTIAGVRKLFTNAGFVTSMPDDESTFLGKALMFDVKLKLDWIWVRGLTPQSYGIDRNLKVSDHFPLWTVVKLPASGSL
jgi:endonuclease/exonuclease/phosphatase family metal-dependent hydrolase